MGSTAALVLILQAAALEAWAVAMRAEDLIALATSWLNAKLSSRLMKIWHHFYSYYTSREIVGYASRNRTSGTAPSIWQSDLDSTTVFPFQLVIGVHDGGGAAGIQRRQ